MNTRYAGSMLGKCKTLLRMLSDSESEEPSDIDEDEINIDFFL